MKLKQIAVVLGILGVIGACLIAVRASRSPISAAFVGCHKELGLDRALVGLSNRTERIYHCWVVLSSSRLGQEQELELSVPVNVTLPPKASAGVIITVPPGTQPACLTCVVMLVDQHNPFIRMFDNVLQRAGIYLYHATAPGSLGVYGSFPQQPTGLATVSSLKLQIGGKKPAGSLSDYLVFQAYSNSWIAPAESRVKAVNPAPEPRGQE